MQLFPFFLRKTILVIISFGDSVEYIPLKIKGNTEIIYPLDTLTIPAKKILLHIVIYWGHDRWSLRGWPSRPRLDHQLSLQCNMGPVNATILLVSEMLDRIQVWGPGRPVNEAVTVVHQNETSIWADGYPEALDAHSVSDALTSVTCD